MFEKTCSLYELQLLGIVQQGSSVRISDIKPSAWVEENIVMRQPRPGPYRYNYTPYCREIIDRLAADDPAKWIAVMKGLQIGISSGVIIPGLVYIIRESPANTYFTVGDTELIEKAVDKLDIAIDDSGSRNYIKPAANRKRNNKSGDTNTKKDFTNGYINITTPNNHKEWRDVSLRYGFIDDFESAKSKSKQSGSSRKLIEGRFAAYKDTHKIYYISTPEIEETSNIQPAYLLGDQRKYMVPCPCCATFIELRWNIPEGIGTVWKEPMPEGTGIVWEYDEDGRVIDESVGYVCQVCREKFTDANKGELLNAGYWEPTAKPKQEGFYSYHISSLYAPAGMYDWVHYVHNYTEACPRDQPRNEAEYLTFLTTCLGIPYKPEAKQVSAKQLQYNQREYAIGTVPELISQRDGNGRIVLLTFACDCNGTVKGVNGAPDNDARIDYEIVAHAESGATYSVVHGSIGTFIPRERSLTTKTDRKKWTYEPGKPNSVWPVLTDIVRKVYKGDMGRNFRVSYPGIDVGFHTDFIMPYIDLSIGRYPQEPMIGMRGHKETEFVIDNRNVPLFKTGAARQDVYFLEVGMIKDMISSYAQLRWDKGNDTSQPANFMNFPMGQLYVCPVKQKYYEAMKLPYEGDYLYQAENYFAHYEAEQRAVVQKANGGEAYRWVKKDSLVQNHMLDCRVYNLAAREIAVKRMGKLLYDAKDSAGNRISNVPPGEFTWVDYVAYITSP